MNSAKVLVRRNSYDDLTPLYKPPSQTEFESVEHNRTNNDYDHSGNDQRSAKLEDNGLYDDLYDFHDIPIEDQLMMAHGIRPHGILDEDNDEDINLDYEYGFDYEKAIRDRLKAANDAFANDSTSSIRKQTRVSFDNSVTAFDTKVEEMSTVHSVNITSDTNNEDLEKDTINEIETKKSLEKIPLNDTVKKDNPDEFQNKLKEIVAKYDADNSVKKPRVVEDKEDDESEILIKHKSPTAKKTSLEEILNNNEQPLSKNSKQNGIKFKNTSFEDSDNDDEIIDEHINVNNNSNNNINSFNNNSNNNSPKKTQKTVKIIDESEDLNKTSHPVESISFDDDHVPTKQETFSFSAPKVIEDEKTNINNSNDSNNNKRLNRRQSDSSTDSDKNFKGNNIIQKHDESDKQQDNEVVSEETGGEKVLIEKDGKFLYVDSDEYTAKEKARIALLEAEEKKLNNDKIAEKPPLLPHPPTRPKTSNGRNIHRVATQESQLKNNSNSEISSVYTGSFVRNAHSADSRSRQQAKIRNEKTEEYAQFYRSPYAISPRRASSQQGERKSKIDTKKEEEEKAEEKRRLNESVFRAWLENKENQRRAELNKKKGDSQENSARSEEAKVSYDAWLEKKREQQAKEKEYQKKLRELQSRDATPHATDEEREKVFKKWLREKLKAKKEQEKQEKQDNKKWVKTLKRSRKHQRLSQAIELAQIYGYTSYYYTSGFKF